MVFITKGKKSFSAACAAFNYLEWVDHPGLTIVDI